VRFIHGLTKSFCRPGPLVRRAMGSVNEPQAEDEGSCLARGLQAARQTSCGIRRGRALCSSTDAWLADAPALPNIPPTFCAGGPPITAVGALNALGGID